MMTGSINGKKAVFVENPKAASHAIRDGLKKLRLADKTRCDMTNDRSHSRHAIAEEGMALNNGLVLGVVRNPYSRMVSGWMHESWGRTDFETWIKGREWFTGELDFKRCPQKCWLANATTTLYFESLDIAWENFCRYESLIYSPLQRINVGTLRRTSDLDWRKYYTTKARDIVEDRFYPDLAYFGYTFDRDGPHPDAMEKDLTLMETEHETIQ